MYACVHTQVQHIQDVHTYVHTYMHTCTHTQMQHMQCIHTCIRAYIHAYIHTYIHTHIRTHIHTHIHTYLHTYMHTYIHTYIQWFTMQATADVPGTLAHVSSLSTCMSCMYLDRFSDTLVSLKFLLRIPNTCKACMIFSQSSYLVNSCT